MGKLLVTNEFGEKYESITDLPDAVATADAEDQGATYVEADAQSLTTLVNALKAAHNELLAALKGE